MSLVIPVIPQPTPPYDFKAEVRLGNIAGFSLHSKSIRSTNITNTGFLDLWGGSSNLVYPIIAESWEIASDNANDTLAGSGARVVQVTYLDASYDQDVVNVFMDGTNPVVISNDCFRLVSATVVSSGTGQANEGKLTINAVVGGAERGALSAGMSMSLDTFVTVPAGKTLLVLVTHATFPKNEDGNISTMVMPFGTNTWITTSQIPFYQSAFSLDQLSLPAVAEKTDIKFQANSTNVGPIDVSIIFEYYLADNTI